MFKGDDYLMWKKTIKQRDVFEEYIKTEKEEKINTDKDEMLNLWKTENIRSIMVKNMILEPIGLGRRNIEEKYVNIEMNWGAYTQKQRL